MSNIEIFENYFQRLGVKLREPSLTFISELQRKHTAELCFNSLSVLLQRPFSLDILDIIDKLVIQNLGGYCYEHNKLMHDVLDALGFEVRCLMARVINNQGINAPRTHRITLLKWEDGQYLVDVGFGHYSPQAPIKIENGGRSIQNRSTYRIFENALREYQLELIAGGDVLPLYTFNLNHYTEADCVMGNFYSSHHPDAVFVNNLVISRILPEITLSLRNNRYHRIDPVNTEVISIIDHLQLQHIIKNDFNIELSDSECRMLYEKTCAGRD